MKEGWRERVRYEGRLEGKGGLEGRGSEGRREEGVWLKEKGERGWTRVCGAGELIRKKKDIVRL